MHLRTQSVNSNTLAYAQSAETASALRRAKELRDAANHLSAVSLDGSARGSPDQLADHSTEPQSVAMVAAWAGQNAPSQSASPASQPGGEEAITSKPARAVSFWA